MRALGAYLYAGGFALGVRHAGFAVVAHLEGEVPYGVSSARLNWPDLPIHHGPTKWPLDDLRNLDIDFAFANPPCAIFSSQGIVTTRGPDSWREDGRLDHWWDSFRVLERVEPRAWALESVTQAYSRGRPLIDEMTKKALVRGYSVTHLLLDAKWHGIPQSRRRFFLVAHRPPKLVGYAPTRNWAPPPTVGETLELVHQPGWAWELKPNLQKLLDQAAPGELLCDVFDRIVPEEEKQRTSKGTVGRPSFRHKRLDPAVQMGAYIAGDFYHPTENRVIGINESKALCGYPEDFQLAPPERDWPHLLARAVMPPVGEWLARSIEATLTQPDADWASRRVTLVDVRKPGIPEVDLTGEYLDDGGRVRLRARTDGSVTWSWPSGSSKAPPARSERVTVLSGISPPDRPSSRETIDEINDDPRPIEPPRGQDRGDGETARDLPSTEPASDCRPLSLNGGASDREASGGRTAEAAPDVIKLQGGIVDPDRRYAAICPEPGEGSGRFMQCLWRTTDLSPEEILVAVHASYAGRTTARGDVYYNYKKLVDAGEVVRPWPGPTRRTKGVTVESARTPNLSFQGAASDSGTAHGTNGVSPLGADTARAPALAAPALDPEGRSPGNEGTTAETRPAVPEDRPIATGLGARSTVVPERRGVVDRALLYFSKLFRPEETASPLSSARMAWFLEGEVGFDAVYHQGAYSTEVVPAKIGELWVVNSSWMWNTDEWRRVLMRLLRVSDRIVFCQNDYALILNSYHLGVIRDDCNYVVLSTAPETSYMEKHGLRPTLVNWNSLTYLPRAESDVERRPCLYYYGSFRAGRQKVFDRYFRDPPEGLVVSASSGADVKRYQQAYPNLEVVPRAEDVYRELEAWAATLLLEDERSSRTYVSPPNRFYEALSSRCPMIFDVSSIAMFHRYGFDVEACAVNGPRDLGDHLGTPDWVNYVGDLQQEWHRDYLGELRAQLAEARALLDRGELGRRGAPAHLKRYVLQEDGGEY